MTTVRVLTIAALTTVLGAETVLSQSLSRYREYSLDTTLAAVLIASGARPAEVKTLHNRPVLIQELVWHAPYVAPGTGNADPLQSVLFRFYDGRLYRVEVAYDRERIEGLTNSDLIESISAAYHDAIPLRGKNSDSPPIDMPSDTIVVARWDDGTSVLSLVQGGYSRAYQLVLTSKELSAGARNAINEAIRLEGDDAPQRELDRQKKEHSDAVEFREKTRALNKAAFKP
jgi:hypothetical protein